MRFAIDYIALGIVSGGLLTFGLLKFYLFAPRPIPPSLAFSRLDDLRFPSWRSRWVPVPRRLHLAALLLLVVAFIDPQLLFPKFPSSAHGLLSEEEIPTAGLALYLVLDQSGSMAQTAAAQQKNGQEQQVVKIDLLKQVTRQFILDHPSDLIGLVSFARLPRVLVPLTLDREALLQQLERIQPITDPEKDGTSIGYAIFKTASVMAATRHFSQDLSERETAPYTIKGAAMILVTDGFQNPSRLDQGNRLRTLELDDAAAYAKSQNIRLYIINIDPSLASASYAPQRRQLEAVASETGGRFYLLSRPGELQEVYAAIDQLEKGTIRREAYSRQADSATAYSRFSLTPFFLITGLSFLLSALLLESWVLRTVP